MGFERINQFHNKLLNSEAFYNEIGLIGESEQATLYSC